MGDSPSEGLPGAGANRIATAEALRPGRPRVTVIIPAKNEARNIGWVLERLPALTDELIVIDGDSTDDTIAVTRSVRPDAVVISDRTPGKGAAVRIGINAATGDYVVMLDADGSMDPGEIPAFIALLDAGADVVKGSRFLPGGGTHDLSAIRSLGNGGLRIVANWLFGVRQTELCYGYAAFRRTRVQRLELTATGFEIEAQLFLRSYRNGLRVAETPSFELPRRSGVSNLHAFRDGWRILRTIVRERVRRPASSAVMEPETSASVSQP